jgi:hypothetical protein
MRKTTLVAAGAALVLTLTACSGNASSGGTAAPAGGAKDSSTLFSDAVQLASASKQGTEKSKSAKFTMESAAAGQTVKASGAISVEGGNIKMAMTMDAAGQQMEMRFVDRTIYMKVPEAEKAQLGADKQWMKISADGTDPFSQAFGKILDQAAQQSDPGKILEQVSKTGKILSGDQTQLDGAPVSHYKVEMDVSKALEEFSGTGVDVSKLQGKDIKLPMELWLDKNQLPVQVVVDSGPMLKAMGTPGAPSEAKTTIKYSDWGTAVDVAAPPADQVADISEMMKGLGGH